MKRQLRLIKKAGGRRKISENIYSCRASVRNSLERATDGGTMLAAHYFLKFLNWSNLGNVYVQTV